MANKRSHSFKEQSNKIRRRFLGSKRASDNPSIGDSVLESAPQAITTFPASTVATVAGKPSSPTNPGNKALDSPPTTPHPRHVDIFDALKTIQAQDKGKGNKKDKKPQSPRAVEETPKRKAALFFTAGLHVFDKHARDILAQHNMDSPRYNAPSIAETAGRIWAEMVENDCDERKFWDDVVLEARAALANGEVDAEELMRANGLPEKEEKYVHRAETVVEAYFAKLEEEKEKEKEEDEAEDAVLEQAEQLTPVRAKIVIVGSK